MSVLSLLPCHFHQLLHEDFEASSMSARGFEACQLCSMSWVYLRVFSQMDVPGTPPQGGIIAPQLAPVDTKEQQPYLETFSDDERES